MKDRQIQFRWLLIRTTISSSNISTWSWAKQCKRTNNKTDKACSNKCKWAWFRRCRWEPWTSKTSRANRRTQSNNSNNRLKSNKRTLKAKIWLSKTQCNFNRCNNSSRTSRQITMTPNKCSNKTCKTTLPSKMATSSSSNLIHINSKHS